MKIFGREPAAIEAITFSLIALAGAFIVELSTSQQGALNAATAAGLGLVTAFVLKSDGLLAAVTGFAKAVLAVALAFGLHVTPENQAIIMLAVSNLAAFFIVRPNVTAPIGPNG